MTGTRTAIEVLFFCWGAASLACTGPSNSNPTSAEQRTQGFLEASEGLAPFWARLVYPGSTCSAPDWSSVHSETEFDWPTFNVATVADLEALHPSLQDEDELIVVREPNFTQGIEVEFAAVLGVTTWAGSEEILCGGAPLSGRQVALTGWFDLFPQDVSQEEMFERSSRQADRMGLQPLTDLDVAVRLPLDE